MNQGGTPLFRFSDRARTRVFEHLIRFNQPDSPLAHPWAYAVIGLGPKSFRFDWC